MDDARPSARYSWSGLFDIGQKVLRRKVGAGNNQRVEAVASGEWRAHVTRTRPGISIFFEIALFLVIAVSSGSSSTITPPSDLDEKLPVSLPWRSLEAKPWEIFLVHLINLQQEQTWVCPLVLHLVPQPSSQ